MPDTLNVALTYLCSEIKFYAIASSRYYITPAWPPGSGPEYINAAIRVETSCAPAEVLATLHAIEARLGREREGVARWSSRVIDLDLLASGDAVLPDAATQDAWRTLPAEQQISTAPEQLILPHPRLQDRAFVLVPLAEIAPNWVHPRLKLDVRSLLARLPAADRAAIRPIDSA